MLDETTEETDNKIAQHILRLHRYKEGAFSSVPYTTEQVQRYIKYTRAIKPEMTDEAATRMVCALGRCLG
jgi:DNA replication licensing factor MCM6